MYILEEEEEEKEALNSSQGSISKSRKNSVFVPGRKIS